MQMALPKRNLRTTTLQSTIAHKAKALAVITSGPSSKTSRPIPPIPARTTLDQYEEGSKENAVPRSRSQLSSMGQKMAWDDLDAEDAEDPLMVSEYVVEIFEYMRELEKKIMPAPNYIAQQKELNWHMRAVLIDWLIDVQAKSKLLPETLFLSINIVDRLLSRRAVSVVKLQLVGLAATLVASKYEEVLALSIANFIYLSDNSYEDQELLKAERYVLNILNFNLAYPNPLVFLRRISKADSYDARTRTLAKYLMELTLLSHLFLPCPPSLVAATGMWTARVLLKSGPWNANLAHYSGYEESEIKPWADCLFDFLKQPMRYEAIYRKYSVKKLMKASIFVQEYMKKTFNVDNQTDHP